MRKNVLLAAALSLGISAISHARPTYDNGPLITHPGGGFGGADVSMLQTPPFIILGYGHGVAAGDRIADDFTVTDAGGWDIKSFTFYAYESFSTTTSTITHVNYRIWDGQPGLVGSNIIHDFSASNELISTQWSGIYRTSDSDFENIDRPIMENLVDSNGVTLGPGTYWLDWQSDGLFQDAPWVPPITILGTFATGNAVQFDGIALQWAPAVDSGFQQGIPFLIDYNVIPTPAGLALFAISGIFIVRRRR